MSKNFTVENVNFFLIYVNNQYKLECIVGICCIFILKMTM